MQRLTTSFYLGTLVLDSPLVLYRYLSSLSVGMSFGKKLVGYFTSESPAFQANGIRLEKSGHWSPGTDQRGGAGGRGSLLI